MMQAGLTVQQQKAFEAICTFTAQRGHTPTFEELREKLGCKSKSNIVRLVTALVDRGYITRLPRRARSIAIVMPATPASAPLPTLSPALQARLEAYCRVNGESVEAIIHDAVALFLDQEEGAIAA